MSSIVTEHFRDFLRTLEGHKRQVPLSRTDSRILKTMRWLISSQKANGAWGQNDVATTAISMIALQGLSPAAEQWELSSDVRSVLQKGARFLVDKHGENSWESAVWDTAIAVRALFLVGDPQDVDFVNQRVAWLIRETDQPSNYGPHHIAQSIITLFTVAAHRDVLQRNCDHLEQTLGKNVDRYSPYVLGQCIEALCTTNHDSEMIPPIAVQLKDYLASARLDHANLLNICLALQGLWLSPGKGNIEIGRLSSASLFGSTCFRDTGSWYNSELHTAWALITLARFSQELVLQVPYSELLYEYDQLRVESEGEIARLQKKNRNGLIINLFVAAGWASLLAAFVTYTTLKPDMYEWLKWAVPSLIGLMLAYNVRAIFRKSQ